MDWIRVREGGEPTGEGLQLRAQMRSRQGGGGAPSWMSAPPPPEVRVAALELGHRRLGAAPGHAAAQGARIGRTEVAGC